MRRAVGDYVLEARLEHGGGGLVWRARTAEGRPVRVRVTDPQRIKPAQAVRAFERLTAALTRWARQGWPGIEVPVGTVLPDASGRFALATAWVDGGPALEVLPPSGRDRLDAALAVATDVGATLAAMHAAGAVHGAVAAHDVWIGPRGTTVLSFWWSQANLRDHPGPLAPEVIASGGLDARADQWAWGRMLRELLGPPDAVPADLSALCARATAAAPVDRFPDLNGALTALRVARARLPSDPGTPRVPTTAPPKRTTAVRRDALPPAAEPPAACESPTDPAEAPTRDLAPAPERPRAVDAGEPTLRLPHPRRPGLRLATGLVWAAALGLVVAALAGRTDEASAPPPAATPPR